ncbi:MAG: acetyl esterase/lipase [Paracoccaceae bacterium]|jgi:acetyl esterase/lipase
MTETRNRLACLLARYIQRPTLKYVAHQPTLRVIFEIESRLTHRRLSGTQTHKMTLRHQNGSVSGTWIKPAGISDRGIVLYLHGGAFTIGSTATHRELIARLAQASQTTALAIDYRRAPEHPFPAALDDALTAYSALLDQGTRAETITLAGDSAGGGLCVSLCHALQIRNMPQPAALALMSPLTDMTFSGASARKNLNLDPLIPAIWGQRAINLYLDGHDPSDPLASPLFGDMRYIPPTIIHVADTEILLDDATRLAEALLKVNKQAVLKVFSGLPHVWQIHGGWLPQADASLAELGAFLACHLPDPYGDADPSEDDDWRPARP